MQLNQNFHVPKEKSILNTTTDFQKLCKLQSLYYNGDPCKYYFPSILMCSSIHEKHYTITRSSLVAKDSCIAREKEHESRVDDQSAITCSIMQLIII